MVSRVKKTSDLNDKLQAGDALTSMDGQSLRYMNPDLVVMRFLEPRYSTATLEFEREVKISKQNHPSLKKMGIGMTQTYNGLIVKGVRKGSYAELMGVKEGDIVMAVNGEKTRYLSLREAVRLIDDGKSPELSLLIRRSVAVARK